VDLSLFILFCANIIGLFCYKIAMLEYMYTGETEGLAVKAPDLMQIAEKYDIPGLKEDCENSIAQSLTIENVSEILVMAHMYNANTLKPKAIEFINRYVRFEIHYDV